MDSSSIFDGYQAANIQGIRQGTSNPVKTLPENIRDYPNAIAAALNQLRLVGVNRPYAVTLARPSIPDLPKPAITAIWFWNT